MAGKMTIDLAESRGIDGCTFALPDQKPALALERLVEAARWRARAEASDALDGVARKGDSVESERFARRESGLPGCRRASRFKG